MKGWFPAAVAMATALVCSFFGSRSHRELQEVRARLVEQAAGMEALAVAQQKQLGATVALQTSLRNVPAAPCAGERAGSAVVLDAPPATSEPASKPPAVPAVPPEETARAVEAAKNVVDAALIRGAWTERDYLDLRKNKPLMTGEQYQAERERIMTAANSGKLRVDNPRMLF